MGQEIEGPDWTWGDLYHLVNVRGKSVTGGRGARARRSKTTADKTKASFGMTVTLRRDDGREQSFRIVGEDEADPSRGTVSYVSPLARAVLTHGPGETVEIAGRKAAILGVREDSVQV